MSPDQVDARRRAEMTHAAPANGASAAVSRMADALERVGTVPEDVRYSNPLSLMSYIPGLGRPGSMLPGAAYGIPAAVVNAPGNLKKMFMGAMEETGQRVTGQVPPGTPLSADMLGLLMSMPGAGMLMGPKGAVGMSGGRLAPAAERLPMDEASRMARADAGGSDLAANGEAMDSKRAGAEAARLPNILSSPTVRERASELESLLKRTFPELTTEVLNSVTPVGKSSYLSFHYQPQARGKYTAGEVRISDHDVGMRRAGDYVDHVMVDKPYSADGLLEKIRASIARANGASLPMDEASRMARMEDGWARAGAEVDGRIVRKDVPNLGSISASFDKYDVLPGVREIPMGAMDAEYRAGVASRALDVRTQRLADEIAQSREINPLIVAVDKDGPYILEGAHRYDALVKSGAKSFPAVVVRDNTEWLAAGGVGPVGPMMLQAAPPKSEPLAHPGRSSAMGWY